MSTTEKELDAIRRNQSDVSFETIRKFLMRAGCRERASSGSHHVFYNPDKHVTAYPAGITVPYRRPVKKIYVRQFLEYYDALMGTDNE